MATTQLTHLYGHRYQNRGCNWTEIWAACQGPIFRVVDEEENNVYDAQIRHLQGRYWLYVDDQDGYSVMHEDDAERLILAE